VLGVDRASDAGIDAPGCGEPLVHLRPGRQRGSFAHCLPGEQGIEAGKAAVPAGSGQRSLIAVGEGMGKHQDASPALGPQLEPQRTVALPGTDQQLRRVAVADSELAGKPAAQLAGVGQGSPDTLGRLVVTPLEAQHGTGLEAGPAKAQARDERPARGRVEPEAGGVALVALPDRLVGAFLGQVLAGQLRTEPVEVALPSRGCLGGQLRPASSGGARPAR